MGYIGMCGHKGYGFSADLVINRFGHFGHKWGMVFQYSSLHMDVFLSREATFSSSIEKKN